ncbi:MAG: cysteine synthase family protein [Candidatus Adiutricales bacterium]
MELTPSYPVDYQPDFGGETFVNTILERVGNTPLIRVRNLDWKLYGVQILAKAEWFNPGGSVKDRPALRMIQDAETSGELTREKTILDSSSGNMAVSYSMIGAAMGYKVKVVVPSNISQAHLTTIKSFGTEVVFSDALEGSDGAIRLAHEIAEKDPDQYYMPNQYSNPSNWKAHYFTTAQEIWAQTQGQVTHLVAGVGTSGTLMGTGRGLKDKKPSVEIIAVEPDNGLHGIEGLKVMKESIVPGIYDPSVIDRTIHISTEEAYAAANDLAATKGLFAGSSSGAAMAAALKVAHDMKQRGVIVVIFPDGGIRLALNRKKFLDD